MTEAEKLAALDRAATQGQWYADCDQVWEVNGPQICDTVAPNLCENAALIVALVNAYRAKQVVLIGPDAVEKVARALEKALAFDVESDVYAGELTHEERCKLARAALAALTGRV